MFRIVKSVVALVMVTMQSVNPMRASINMLAKCLILSTESLHDTSLPSHPLAVRVFVIVENVGKFREHRW